MTAESLGRTRRRYQSPFPSQTDVPRGELADLAAQVLPQANVTSFVAINTSTRVLLDAFSKVPNNMRSFKIIPHIGDMRLRVEASSLEELFKVSLEGMNQVLKKDFCARRNGLPEIHEIQVSSPDTTSLLVDFLSETLTLSHIHRAIFCHVKFAKLGSDSLSARLFGAKVEAFDEDVKAVSYHEAEVVQNGKGNYQTNLVFDV